MGFHGLLKPLMFYWSTSGDPVLAELLCSIPGCLKQLIQVVAAAAEGKGCSRGQSCSRGPCACALHPCMNWPRVAVGVSLCSQLGVPHLLQVLSFPPFSPHLGPEEHRAEWSQGLPLFCEAAPDGTCCWLTQPAPILTLLYPLAYYTAFTSFHSPQHTHGLLYAPCVRAFIKTITGHQMGMQNWQQQGCLLPCWI